MALKSNLPVCLANCPTSMNHTESSMLIRQAHAAVDGDITGDPRDRGMSVSIVSLINLIAPKIIAARAIKIWATVLFDQKNCGNAQK